jgi:8-amino-7-oxononanoate synthase
VDPYESFLKAWRDQSLLRQLQTSEAVEGCVTTIEGQRLLNFASNDYLGLSLHPEVRAAAKAALEQFGLGAGASRLISGSLGPHRRLETTLADFKGCEAALTFSSGFATALGVIPALVGPGDIVILDKLAHACLIDGAKLSGATLRVYPHNHLDRLHSLLKWATEKVANTKILIVTESVFSMDGDSPDLTEIVQLKARYGVRLLLDEAHATGVRGPSGRGLAAEAGLTDAVDVHLGTLSKAVGASGGFIAGRKSLIDFLVNRARSFIFSTASPPSVAAGAEAALRIIRSEAGESLRKQLNDNVQLLGRGLSEDAALINDRFIFPVLFGSEARAIRAAQSLRAAGFLVPAIRYPTVARGTARLRVTVTAGHSPAQIVALTSGIKKQF